MSVTKEKILEALKKVEDPDLHKDLVSLNMIGEIVIDSDNVSVTVKLTTPACPLKNKIKGDVEDAIREIAGVSNVEVKLDAVVPAMRQKEKGERLPLVKNIIAVGSGKGGVGKSTVAVNMASALAMEGAYTGLLDADIYGPSIPIMFGLNGETPQVSENRKIIPFKKYGVTLFSMGFLIKESDAVIWRGPMLARALQQFIEEIEWGALDYLVVDLPPGTGDVQLSLTQLIPLTGAVIVTTPQDVAFADVRRAIRMFETTKTPILGILENMSHYICSETGKHHYIFGRGRTEKKASELGVPFLGSLPIDERISLHADNGEPIVIAEPESEVAVKYREIARLTAARQSIVTVA